MPTVIHDGIPIDPQRIETESFPCHTVELTTENILKSLHEIERRPEMAELDRLLMASNAYVRGN